MVVLMLHNPLLARVFMPLNISAHRLQRMKENLCQLAENTSVCMIGGRGLWRNSSNCFGNVLIQSSWDDACTPETPCIHLFLAELNKVLMEIWEVCRHRFVMFALCASCHKSENENFRCETKLKTKQKKFCSLQRKKDTGICKPTYWTTPTYWKPCGSNVGNTYDCYWIIH